MKYISFYIRGKLVICSPEVSCKHFMRTEMNVLTIKNFILLKKTTKF